MSARPFEVEADGARLGGTLRGDGHPVLLLHGGPGLGVEYVEPLADELAAGYAVATYQQRGIAPSRIEGPFSVGDHVADAVRVLDGLGWERATLVGHSWGGHLALHVAAVASERLTGVLAVDPLGAVGDGGMAQFGKELGERTPPEDRIRAEELDERVLRGEGTAEDDFESMRLYWPAYFSSRETAPPMPAMGMSTECYAETMESIQRELPALEQALPSIAVPVGFVVGGASPMPVTASADAADRIPGAWVESVDGAGHFVWFESPGSVRSALDRLTNG
jgi:pimeloyl-ACP methyl ester carboxylesterase